MKWILCLCITITAALGFPVVYNAFLPLLLSLQRSQGRFRRLEFRRSYYIFILLHVVLLARLRTERLRLEQTGTARDVLELASCQ